MGGNFPCHSLTAQAPLNPFLYSQFFLDNIVAMDCASEGFSATIRTVFMVSISVRTTDQITGYELLFISSMFALIVLIMRSMSSCLFLFFTQPAEMPTVKSGP